MINVAIVGASGFTGAELMRLCAAHPELQVRVATADTQAGEAVADLYPSLAAAYGTNRFVGFEPERVDGCDVAFLGLPHGASQAIVPELADRVGSIVDLSADFRLKDPDVYAQWYGSPHTATQWLDRFVYGLPELYRADIMGAQAVAAPGCYPTAAALALSPLLQADILQPAGVIVDAASGVSGAGRAAKANTTFCAVDEDFVAYGLLDHRHTPEIEQTTGAQVLFTPHLVPMNRGILATCYARPARETSTDELIEALAKAYAHQPFVVVSERPPSTKATLGSNAAHLTARYDERTGYAIVLCAIDNLVKGASGQAIQCANLMLGFEESAGLPTIGVSP